MVKKGQEILYHGVKDIAGVVSNSLDSADKPIDVECQSRKGYLMGVGPSSRTCISPQPLNALFT